MTYDIFISYKRISIETANNLYYRLTQKGYSVFYDVEEMRTDTWEKQIEEYIKSANDVFILIEPMSLESCKNGKYKKDWFCKEIAIALENEKHIIPMLLKDFKMPQAESLPLELRKITSYNAPAFNIAYFDEYIDRLINKNLLNSRKRDDYTNQSAFKFLSNEDCAVYEGTKLIGKVQGRSEDPFYVFVKRKGEFRYNCINIYTTSKQTIKESIDTNEEKFIEIEWKKEDRILPYKGIAKKPNLVGKNVKIQVGNYEFEMVRVNGGMMKLGTTGEQTREEDAKERGAFEKEMRTFYIGKFPVTQTLWAIVMGYNNAHFKSDLLTTVKKSIGLTTGIMSLTTGIMIGSALGPLGTIAAGAAGALYYALKGQDEYPMENISFDEAKEFVTRLSEMTNIQFSIPTEDEWEYAARGGMNTKHFKYAGSNDINEVGWYRENSEETTHPVGKKLPNELGIYDMSGNIWEWTESQENNTSKEEPKGNENFYIRRGGSWWHVAENCEVSKRYITHKAKKTSGLGLRLVIRNM